MEAVRERLIEQGYISRNVVVYGSLSVTKNVNLTHEFDNRNGWKTVYVSTEDGLYDALETLYRPCVIAFDKVPYVRVPVIYPDGYYELNIQNVPSSKVFSRLLSMDKDALRRILEYSPLEKQYVDEAMSIITSQNTSDRDDWDTIRALREWVTKNGYAQSDIHRLTKRANRRAADVLRFMRSKPNSILDIGCADGLILSALCIRIKPSYALGVDVRESKRWNELRTRSLDYKSIAPEILLDDPSAVISRSFDLITCFMSLHHIGRWDEVIMRCVEMLNPGGKLLIREQLFEEQPPIDSYVSYIQHALYAMVWGRTVENPLYPFDYYTYHMTANDLMKTAERTGFRRVRIHVERYHTYLLFVKPREKPVKDGPITNRRRHFRELSYAPKRKG